MEKRSRIQKYKELREEMKEEVAINRHIDTTSVDEEDDFLAFIPKTKQEDMNDTLMKPLSYETLDEDSNVQHALNEAKVNIGKEQFNTRLDILNKIKKEDIHEPRHIEEDHVYEEKQEEPKKMSLLEKLAAMSPEEDAEELRKYEEETSIEQLMKSQKSEKKAKKEKVLVEEYEDEEDEDDGEEENKVVKVLNYVILVFIVIFLVLIGFIVKQMFF